MHHFFIKLHSLINKNKWAAAAGIFVISFLLVFFAFQIKFEEDITRILPNGGKGDVTARVVRQMDFSDKIIVLFEKGPQGSLEEVSQVATAFLDSLSGLDNYIESTEGNINNQDIQETFDFVYDNLPLFLDLQDYVSLEKRLNRDSIYQQVEQNYKTLISPTGIVAKDFILNDPFGLTFMALERLQQLNVGDDFYLYNGFLTTGDDTKSLLFISPKFGGSETEKNTVLVERLREIQEKINTRYEGSVELDYYGAPFIAVANAKQIKNDILVTLSVSLSSLMLILIVFYRTIRIPFILFIPTILGTIAALAFLYFLKGAVSAISVSIGAVLLGVTIDYSLHVLTHYRNKSDIKGLYKGVAKPVIISSATTAAAFLCLLFVNSEILSDLGIFAAVSVLISAFLSLLLFPHLYNPKDGADKKRRTFIDKIAGIPFHKSKFWIAICVLLIVVSLFTYENVEFNHDISKLNYVPPEIERAAGKLEETTNLMSKSVYVVAYGDSPKEVLQKNYNLYEKLKSKKEAGEIQNFSSLGGILLPPEEQQKKIEMWTNFWSGQRAEKAQELLISAGEEFGFKPTAYQKFFNHLQKEFDLLIPEDFKNFAPLSLNDFLNERNGFYTASTVVKISEEQRDSFIASVSEEEGIVLIDRKQMNETFLGHLKENFSSLIGYSFLVIVLLLFIFFKRIELVIMAIIPILLTGIVTAGIMGAFGLEFNIFSLIVCTLIFGLGVDFSIFMTTGLQKKLTYGTSEINTYKASILLAVLTTVLSIGALVFAKHPALRSVSLVSVIGVLSAVLITFVFYPLLFRFCITERIKNGKAPITLRLFLHSAFSFTYYGTGGIVLALFGKFLMKVVPVKHDKKIVWFRKLVSLFLKSVLYTNPNVAKRVRNQHNEDFETPSVIIANHTSFLDSLAVGMLSHKIIFLVNDWVYNSYFLGGVAKLAGYYPVSQGLEGSVEHLREKVEEGYSLMVFPEGTRSYDNVVRRFHKGAFYLAEHFDLDILPVYIHGNSEVIPKGDYVIYDEDITVEIGSRIKAGYTSFGNGYRERTKAVSVHFRENFNGLREELEGEDYFKNKLFLSFLYKENSIIKAVKEDFEKNKKLYYLLNKHIGKEETVLHFANDYGQLDFLLVMQEAKRKVQSFIPNAEKRNIAKTNYIVRKRNIQYIERFNEYAGGNVLLISGTQPGFEDDFEKLQTDIDRVILVIDLRLKDLFIKNGFKVIHEEEGILVLKK